MKVIFGLLTAFSLAQLLYVAASSETLTPYVTGQLVGFTTLSLVFGVLTLRKSKK